MNNVLKYGVIFWIVCFAFQKSNAQVSISIELKGNASAKAREEAFVYIHRLEENSSLGILPISTTIRGVIADNSFNFNLDNNARYVTLLIPTKEEASAEADVFTLSHVMLEPRDSIHIIIDDDRKVSVTGRNHKKYKWYLDFYRLREEQHGKNVAFDRDPTLWLTNELAILQRGKSSLDSLKPSISPTTYNILNADLIGRSHNYMYRTFRTNKFGYSYGDSIGKVAENLYKNVLNGKKERVQKQSILEQSAFYASYLLQKTWTEEAYRSRSSHSPISKELLQVLNLKYPKGILKDKIMLAYLFRNNLNIDEEFFEVKDKIINSEKYISILNSILHLHQSGNIVDSTAFVNSKGEKLKLMDFKGKVLYIDFWFTGCAGCLKIAKALPKIEEALSDEDDIVFVSISIDKAREKWLNSITPDNTSYNHFVTSNTLYLNTDGRGAEIPLLRRFNKINSYPFMIIVDRDGRIVSTNPPRPDKNGGMELIMLLKDIYENQTYKIENIHLAPLSRE